MNHAELRKALEIDRDALDVCLEEQPSLYYHVAEGYTKAVAQRDSHKLALDELTAELDQQIRKKADDEARKITEASIQREMALFPKVKDATKRYYDAKALADEWLALKEAWQQRSFMLREIVALRLGELTNLSLERGAHGAQQRYAEVQSDRASLARSKAIKQARVNVR